MADSTKDPREGLFELVPVRLNYPHLHVAHTPQKTKQNPNPRTQFQTTCIIDNVLLGSDQGRKLLGAVIIEIKRVAVDKFRERANNFMTKVLHSKQGVDGNIASDVGLRSPFGDGAAKDFGPCTLTFNLRGDYPFSLVDVDNNAIPVIEGKNPPMFYSGCYVSVWVAVGSYNNEGQGISLYPRAMKFIQDGERLDNRVEASSLYGGPLDKNDRTNIENLINGGGAA